MQEFCFSKPRIIMQRCCASMTTTTSRTLVIAHIDSAIFLARFSRPKKGQQMILTQQIQLNLFNDDHFVHVEFKKCAIMIF